FPNRIAIGDVDGDQVMDLVAANSDEDDVSVLLQSCTQTCQLAGTAYCFGDGSLATPCPCVPPNTVPNPSGATGSGCANGFNASGASLIGCGVTNPDSVVLRAQGVSPAGLTLFVKGSAETPGGLASGDGVLCAGGAIVRFGAQNAVDGRAHYPNAQLGQTIPVSTFSGTPP